MGEDPTTQMSEPTTTTITTSTCSGYSTPPAPIPPPPFPEEVLDNILLFITTPSDRNAVSLVCKSWNRAESVTRTELFIGNCYAVSPLRAIQRFQRIRSVVLKGKPRFADFNLVPPNWGAHFTPWLKPIVSAYPWLEKLCLKRMSVSNVDLILLSCSFPGFKELALVCCEGFGTSGLAALASGCRQLQALDLIDDEVMDEDFDWLSFFPETKTCLESLVFECVECPVNFEALEALVARSPSLKKLRVNQQVCIEQLHRLMAWAPQLTHLGTGSFSSNNPFVQGGQEQELSSAFAACRSLVCLSGFRDIAPEYLLSLRHVCANLISLNFSYAALDTEQLTSVIRHCHKLQNLWVLDSVGDEGLQAVATTCTDLRELRVFPMDVREDGEASVSEVGLLAISQGCRKLQSILYFCQHMTNAAVIAMSNNCPELVVFRLCIMGRQKPDHVTGLPMDEGFGAIVQNCKKLTRLAVSGLLTDRAFSYIGEYGKSVRTLSVAFAGDSDMGLRYVLEGCPKLQKLEIRDSPFGDGALLSGMHHYYNMRFLWMSSCNLSIEGCKDLARRLPNLRVEVIKDREEAPGDVVEKLYMYRSLEGRRDDAPEFVTIL